MFHRQIEFPAFHVTSSEPCPYLDGRRERKIFTIAPGNGAELIYDTLAKHGFRRTQFALYKPACMDCKACISVRIRAADFAPSASQKRILQHNRHLKRTLAAPIADMSQYELFKKYIAERHGGGSMADMTESDYQEMVEETAVRTWLVMYSDSRPAAGGCQGLVAACITDVLDDGVSMLYSYFDPDRSKSSLGTYMVLDHVQIAKASKRRLKYVYLGYWIPTSKKMEYKSRFSPLEVLRNGHWTEMTRPEAYTPDHFPDP